MARLHLTRNLRSLAFIAVVLAAVAAIAGLWWANRTGLPDSWRDQIEQEAAKHGAHIEIGGLQYIPLQGIIATDVQVFADAQHSQELSRLERIILDFDKTKLARGIIHLNKVVLSQARLAMPVNPLDPSAGTLEISEANGTIFMPGNRRLEIRDAHGKIAGIDFTLDARLIGFEDTGEMPEDDSYLVRRRALIAKVLSEVEKWKFDEKQPPMVRITVEGDVNDRTSMNAELRFRARNIGKNGYRLAEVTAEVELVGELLTVSKLQARDDQGVLDGKIDLNMQDREGRFDISSTLEIPPLISAWMGISSPKDILLGGEQMLDVDGNFRLDETNVPDIRMTGHVRCDAVTLRGEPFESVEGGFSWRDHNLFLRDVRLVRPDGVADAKVMVEGSLVRLEVHSTLPIGVYRQLVDGLDSPVERILDDFTAREGGAIDLLVEGGFDLTNDEAWAYTGRGSVKNLNYRGVPVNAAQCKFSLNHFELDFHDGTVEFNYANYALHRAFQGANRGNAAVGRIRFNAVDHVVEVEDVRGAMWAAPVVRFFAPRIADSLEQYRFHEPPQLKANGVIDVTRAGRTALDVSFTSDQPADYGFLGGNLTLTRPRGQVGIRGDKVTVSNLQAAVFGGSIAGDLAFQQGTLRGGFHWRKIPLSDLSATYGFTAHGGGTTTGRIDFSMANNNVRTMKGEGLVALERTELFSVPMFGPLSPLIRNVLNDERVSYQQAKNAFFTFQIRDGILSSSDFQTATKSLNFVGNGSVDMANRTLDMTMRMNARGMLKLITLPLRPFSGLFQFHGSGPLRDTKWERMKFTKPPREMEETLLAPPRATVVPGSE